MSLSLIFCDMCVWGGHSYFYTCGPSLLCEALCQVVQMCSLSTPPRDPVNIITLMSLFFLNFLCEHVLLIFLFIYFLAASCSMWES